MVASNLWTKASYLDFVVELVRHSDQQQGFKVLPQRSVVERTFGWMIRWHRLVHNYETCIDVSQPMILVPRAAISYVEKLTPDFQTNSERRQFLTCR